MPESHDQYREMITQPWGRMFYEQVWSQLEEALPLSSGLRVLDFGSGFGVTAARLAARHRVTALEPSAEMRARRVSGPDYWMIEGGIEALEALPGDFDAVLCHNVLEYVPNRAEIVAALCRRVKDGGLLSVVKHHLAGKVLHNAVFSGDIERALALLEGQRSLQDGTFGCQTVYEIEALYAWAAGAGLRPWRDFGVRAFFGLPQLQETKYDPAWQSRMLELERAAQEREPYRSVAYNRHLILRKPG